jgi:hypothetical protein
MKAERQAFYCRIEELMAVNPRGFRQPSMKRGRIFVTWITKLAYSAFDLQPEKSEPTAPDSKKGQSLKRWQLRNAKSDPQSQAFSAAVSGLTNWQRNRWARAGYPGQREKDETKIAPFALLKHP